MKNKTKQQQKQKQHTKPNQDKLVSILLCSQANSASDSSINYQRKVKNKNKKS